MLYFSLYLLTLQLSPLVFLQTGMDPKGPSDPDLPPADNMLSTHTVSPGEDVPSVSAEAPPPAHLPSVPPASVSLHPEKSTPCDESQPPAPAPAPQPDRAGAEEGLPSEDSCVHILATDTNQSALEEEKSSQESASYVCTSTPSLTFDLKVAEGMSELSSGRPEDSTRSARHHEGSRAVVFFPVAEGQTWLESDGETSASSEIADTQTLSPDVSDLSQSSHGQRVPETEEASQKPLDSSTEVSEHQAEPDISRNLMSSAVFLGGIVSLSIMLQEPSTLFLIGLLLVLRRL